MFSLQFEFFQQQDLLNNSQPQSLPPLFRSCCCLKKQQLKIIFFELCLVNFLSVFLNAPVFFMKHFVILSWKVL